MSAKQAATYHGADIVTRLRVQAPYSDDGQAMQEAAEEIEKLRPAVVNNRAEANALPDRAVILTKGGIVLRKWQDYYGPNGRRGRDAWERPGVENDFAETDETLNSYHFPATILWQP